MRNRAAGTAFGPMAILAVDQNEEPPLLRDGLARRFVVGGTRGFVAANRWGPIRRWTIGSLERRVPGLWANILCRKRYVDDKLVEATRAGIGSVVILGAGFDDRAYRLPALAEVPVYEVDLPENIDRKRALLRKLYGGVPDSVRLVPLDFETGELPDALAEHGYRAGERTFFVWEAVTQYLTEASVRSTFDFLATAPSGSGLVFTYVRKDFLDGVAFHGAEAAHRKWVVKDGLWRFGMVPERVPDFLAEYGWRQVEQVGREEFRARYVTPSGRDLEASDIERSVHAERD